MASEEPEGKRMRTDDESRLASFKGAVEALNVASTLEAGSREARDGADGVVVGTHSGTFHCDEALAVAMLLMKGCV